MQQKVVKALDESYLENMDASQKFEMGKIAYSTLILQLSDAILRKVDDYKIVKDLWAQLDKL